MEIFNCNQCGNLVENKDKHTTGYALNEGNQKICYSCCGLNDLKDFINLPVGDTMILYFANNMLTNWPGTFKLSPVKVFHKKQAQFGKDRIDAYFNIEGNFYHGYNIGDNQVMRVKKIKKKKFFWN